MNKRTKAKWLKALRSGNYKQTGNELHTPDGYCCLGVLASCMGVKPSRAAGSPDTSRGGVLSKKYEKVFGITYKQQSRFARLNDSGRYNFLKIADKIERTKLEG